MTTKTSTVRNLRAGQVFSVPDTDMVPALIEAISAPIASVRFIDVVDPADGTPISVRRVLGLDRRVHVHQVDVWHHRYTNITDQRIAVTLGRRHEIVEPSGALHYTGYAQPDVFPLESWDHVSDPVVAETEVRPL